MNKTFVLFIFLIVIVSGCTQTSNVIKKVNFTDNELSELNETSLEESQANTCDGVTCSDSVVKCPDGVDVSCSNTCQDGECSSCEPDCSDRQLELSDLCEDVTCKNPTRICPDGYKATCSNTCDPKTGCSSCTPDCTGHEEVTEEPQNLCADVTCEDSETTCPDGILVSCPNTCNPDTGCSTCTPDCTGHEEVTEEICEENWDCTEWGPCVIGDQFRVCTDLNECGTEENKSEMIRECEVIEGSVFDIIINEVMPNPTEGPEWIELYNPTSHDIDLNGTWINDIIGEGRSAQQIEDVIISSNMFVIVEIIKYPTSYFNNGGDDVNFGIGDTIIDSYTYGSTGKGVSWYRLPNGGEWQETPTESPTKGESN